MSSPISPETSTSAPEVKAATPRAVAIALAVGLLASLALVDGWYRHAAESGGIDLAAWPSRARPPLIVVVVATLLWAIRPVNAGIARAFDRIRNPSRLARRIATLAITLGSATFLYGTAVEYGRQLTPLWHDSNQHMVQAQLIAHGRLWATPHPLADHMETFFVFAKPVYAAIHFPGTSLLYAPLLLLGVPPAIFGALMTGAIVGLTYRVVCELVDGVAAALVVPFILGLTTVRELSVMMISHHMFLVPTLLAFLAFLRWRLARSQGTSGYVWAAAVGCLIAYAGIMRPVEAMAYAVAIGLAMLVTVRRTRAGAKPWLTTAGLILLGASPWLALQLVFDYHVSDGHWLRPPYEHYVQIFQPHVSYGSYGGAGATPTQVPTLLPQKVDYYDQFLSVWLKGYERNGALGTLLSQRLPQASIALTPHPVVFALFAPALLGIRSLNRAVLPIAALAFGTLYLPHVFFLPHYAVALVPVAALLVGLGVQVLGQTFAGMRHRSIEVPIAALLLASSCSGMPQFGRFIRDANATWATSGIYANGQMRLDVQQPAAVLFRYRPWNQPFDPALDNFHDEPTYTIDALWPEESPVARFQDLGPARNREVYRFFADRQPGRNFYLFDRRTKQLTPLGTAEELSERGEPRAYFRFMPSSNAVRAAAGLPAIPPATSPTVPSP